MIPIVRDLSILFNQNIIGEIKLWKRESQSTE